jgi:ArsR family transcriptional regulator, lead/cadmium/zinc/bismuth-responsive transcriptional repressor
MLITDKVIKQNRQLLAKIGQELVKKSQLHFVGSDPTRLRILFLLQQHKELCVTDLAEILNLSISAISHQLSLLERFGLVTSNRMGKTICYCLTRSKDFRL